MPPLATDLGRARRPRPESRGQRPVRSRSAEAAGSPRRRPRRYADAQRGQGTLIYVVDQYCGEQRADALRVAEELVTVILALMSAEFGAAPRTVDDYIARARDRFAVETAATSQEERAATLARLDKLARKLEAQGAWSALVNVERLLADVRGLRRGTVAVETPPPAPAQPFPEVSVEEAIEECFLAVEAVASSWASGSFPTPSPERIEGVREAVRKAAEALGVFPTAPLPRLLGAHYDAE